MPFDNTEIYYKNNQGNTTTINKEYVIKWIYTMYYNKIIYGSVYCVGEIIEEIFKDKTKPYTKLTKVLWAVDNLLMLGVRNDQGD